MAVFPHCNYGVPDFFLSNEFGASFEALNGLNEGEMIFPSWIGSYQGFRNLPSFIELTFDHQQHHVFFNQRPGRCFFSNI